jgi:hypothetical protein
MLYFDIFSGVGGILFPLVKRWAVLHQDTTDYVRTV